MPRQSLIYDRTMRLYFEIEKHFAQGGEALSNQDIKPMIGVNSTSTTTYHLKKLKSWGFVDYIEDAHGTIVLSRKHLKKYPPVAWQDTSKVRIGKRKA